MSKMRASLATDGDIVSVLHRGYPQGEAEQGELKTPNQKGGRCDGGLQCSLLGATGRFGLP